MLQVLTTCFLLVSLGSASEIVYSKILKSENGSCTLIETCTLDLYKGFRSQANSNASRIIKEISASEPNDSKIFTIYAKSQSVLKSFLHEECNTSEVKILPNLTSQQFPSPEIVKIVDSGNQANRIDVVFMGDGYTEEERDKFFADMERLTRDMFEGVTFKSYLPLFNIWAVYVPSPESGIGYDGPKNTPFRLYREKGQLRVIYTGASEYARQVCLLIGASGCDFPSLIANDDFYGGVGGEFVISTRSERTGTFVLRHEMGHNFVQVGDEYDNSWAYFGANNAQSPSGLRWEHWLSSPEKVAEKATFRLLEYPWADLGNLSTLSFPFESDGSYARWLLAVSVSAAGEAGSLEFVLDGEVLPWTSSGSDDREFYEWEGRGGFLPGQHVFQVRSKTQPTHGSIPRMICSITLHEIGNENEYHTDNAYVSAYPTWDDQRKVTYRPTNAGCLMRNISYNQFCSVCKEEMWLQFLEKVSLIDEVRVGNESNPDGTKAVVLSTLKLAHLRDPGNEVDGEALNVRWFQGGELQEGLNDQFVVNASAGEWRVDVEFVSGEVRHDPNGYLKDFIVFSV